MKPVGEAELETAAIAEPVRRFKPYSSYKDSEVAWPGWIPAHWQVKRLKHLVTFMGGGTPSKEQVDYWSGDIPWVSPKDMKTEVVRDAEDHITEEAVAVSATRVVGSGSVLMVVRSGILRHSIPVAINACRVALNQDMKALIPAPEASSTYLAAVIRGEQQGLLTQWRKEGATVESLEHDLIANTRFPVPPIAEQQAITAFLEGESAKIDSLVAKKERVIALLEEKRAALISHVAKRGLDSSVRTKESGVGWLGKIPAHWDVRRLKHLVRFVGGGTPSKESLDYWSGEIPWVSPKDMKTEVLSGAEDHVTEEAVAASATRLVDTGAVLIVVRSGILRHSIPVAINRCIVALNQDMKALIPSSALSSEYLAALIRGEQQGLLVQWRKEGATVESLEHELIANTRCPVPPLAEQYAIAAFLMRETREIDDLVAKVDEAVDRLREFRTALISAAVTGKIDVRDSMNDNRRQKPS